MSEAFVKYIVFIPCVTGPLSVLGSSLIIALIVRSRQQRQQLTGTRGATSPPRRGSARRRSAIENNDESMTPYERLMLGTCIFDLLFSLGWSLGPLPGPAGYLPWSKGSIASCTFQGFIIYIGFASIAYNAMLMILFAMVIGFDISSGKLARIEPFMHAIPIIYYSVTAILGLVWEIYGFAGTLCLVAAYPNGCEVPEVELECTRGGEYVFVFQSWLTIFVHSLFVIIIVVCSVFVAVTVLNRFYRSRRYAFTPAGNYNQKPSQMGARTVREVIIQCSLYSFAFLNNSVWFEVQNALWRLSNNPLDHLETTEWLAAVGLFFLPLQGFFNFLIYIRPRFMAIRVKFSGQSRWFVFKETIWYPLSSPQDRQYRESALSRSGRQSSSLTPEICPEEVVMDPLDGEPVDEVGTCNPSSS